MSEPREIDVALETKEFQEWKLSGKATRESCPLNVKAYEQVRMIEKSAFDQLKAENEKLKDKVALLEYRPTSEILKDNESLRTAKRELEAELDRLRQYMRENYASKAMADSNRELRQAKLLEALEECRDEILTLGCFVFFLAFALAFAVWMKWIKL